MQSICPYCRCEVDPGSREALTCTGCGTPHHKECYDENNGCTLFGCTNAPPDDPKVEVTSSDVSQAAVFQGAPITYTPTGFGDVNAPLVPATPRAVDFAPPPPPPPGTEFRPAQPAAPAAAPSLSPAFDDRVAPFESSSVLFAATPRPPKARLTFILLGIFLGPLGVHNFYAGYWKRGLGQLALTLFTAFFGSVVTWIWAIVEICTVERDSNNVSFA